jgi:hypothetical protein
MLVEWDEEKSRANLEKHGLSFDDAWQVLAGDTITIPDERYDYGEDRLITLGRLAGQWGGRPRPPGCGARLQGRAHPNNFYEESRCEGARNLSKAT